MITLSNIKDIYKAKKCGVGTMKLKGYELIEELFCDSSGFGAPDEPALTKPQLEAKVEEIIKEHGAVVAKITGEGQFQVFVGLFQKKEKAQGKRIANNVLEIVDGDKQTIRLYDTNIIEIEPRSVTLTSGGFRTSTTKKWINKYIPDGASVFQKNFDWFVQFQGGEVVPFEDGMTYDRG